VRVVKRVVKNVKTDGLLGTQYPLSPLLEGVHIHNLYAGRSRVDIARFICDWREEVWWIFQSGLATGGDAACDPAHKFLLGKTRIAAPTGACNGVIQEIAVIKMKNIK